MNNEIQFFRKKTPKELWNLRSEQEKAEIASNTFCRECGVTTVEDYEVEEEKRRVVLKGKCSKCGAGVARVVEE